MKETQIHAYISHAICSMMLFAICISNASFTGSPIILVPGDGGSQIWANLTGKPHVVHYLCRKKTSEFYLLWLSVEQLVPLYLADCLVDNMRLVYNATTHKTINSPGVNISIPGWGTTSNIAYMDTSTITHFFTYYYGPLISKAVSLGYTRDMDILGAPFDFRKAPNELSNFYVDMKILVEKAYRTNDDKRVTIVSHSLAGPVIQYFLNIMTQDWKDKYIHAFITIGSPWGGSLKCILALCSGYDLDVDVLAPWSRTFRALQRTIPSTTFLMPSNDYWSDTEPLVVTPDRNYTVGDYKEFFSDIGDPIGYQMYKDALRIYARMKAPNVTVHCTYGTGMVTPQYYVWKKQEDFPDERPSVVPGKGDGTVNLRSLHGCLRWRTKQSKPIYDQPFPGREHRSMIKDAEVIDYVLKVAMGYK